MDSTEDTRHDTQMAHSTPAESSNFGKATIYVSLGLSLALVAGVLIGARILAGGAPTVSLADLPSQHADSPQCEQFIADVPEEVLDLPRAELAEPAPAGAAAWSDNASQVTVRCGVEMPLQYTAYSQPVTFDDDSEGSETETQWLQVKDQTPGAELNTWYTVNRHPVVAVTVNSMDPENSDAQDQPAAKRPTQLDAATDELEIAQQEFNPAPLSQLSLQDDQEGRCEGFLEAVRTDVEAPQGFEAIPSNELEHADSTVAWRAEGLEPVVVRCGIAAPEVPVGERLQQIDELPWFEDTELADGTTASVWYPLGRDVDIAVSSPQEQAQQMLSRLTKVIDSHTENVDDEA